MIPKVKSDEGFFDRGNQRRLSNPLQMEEKAARVSMEEQNEDYTEIGAQLQLINQLMHEIRNELSPPLDYMVNQQQILFDENLSAEEKIEQIKKENCRRHINALLEIDRILEGRSLVFRMAMGLYNEIERSLDLRELLLDTVAKVRTVQPEKFSIQVLVPDGLGTCLDPIAIQYSIESLIAHAIAHEATSVKIDYLSETSALRFRSNGKQIKMQDRSHILDNASLFGASRGTDFRLASSQFILDKVACSLQFFFWDQGEEQITDAIIQLPMKKVFKAQPPSRPAPANQIPQQDTEILFLQHHLTEMHPCMNNIKRVSSSSSLGSIDQFSTGLSIDISSSSESIAFHHQPNSSEYRSSPASIAKVCTPRCRRFVSSRDRSITSLSKLSQRQLQRIVVVILDDSRAIRFQICRLWKKLCSDLSIELIIHQYSSYEEITTNFFQDLRAEHFFTATHVEDGLNQTKDTSMDNTALFVSIDHNLGNPKFTGADVITWLQDDSRIATSKAHGSFIHFISLTGDETAAGIHLDLGCSFAWKKPPIYQSDHHLLLVAKQLHTAGFALKKDISALNIVAS